MRPASQPLGPLEGTGGLGAAERLTSPPRRLTGGLVVPRRREKRRRPVIFCPTCPLEGTGFALLFPLAGALVCRAGHVHWPFGIR